MTQLSQAEHRWQDQKSETPLLTSSVEPLLFVIQNEILHPLVIHVPMIVDKTKSTCSR